MNVSFLWQKLRFLHTQCVKNVNFRIKYLFEILGDLCYNFLCGLKSSLLISKKLIWVKKFKLNLCSYLLKRLFSWHYSWQRAHRNCMTKEDKPKIQNLINLKSFYNYLISFIYKYLFNIFYNLKLTNVKTLLKKLNYKKQKLYRLNLLKICYDVFFAESNVS